MGTFGIDMGHTLSGVGTGANGFVSETDYNRKVGKRLIQMLQEKGHKVVNCTVDNSSNDLADRVYLANKQPLDLYVSLHLNAFRTTNDAMGVETYIYTNHTASKVYADKVQAELVNRIGWKNRGVKNATFYVLKNTVAPAILIELGFCDSKADMDRFNVENICKAIFKGITGAEYTTTAPTPPPTASNKLYRVMCGSYGVRANAERQVATLKAKGIDAVIMVFDK